MTIRARRGALALAGALALVLAGQGPAGAKPHHHGTAYTTRQTCRPTTESEIAALFDRWNASLKTGDAHKVAANYAPRSILLPTLSNKPRITEAEKLDYFEHFLEKKPQGKIDMRMIQIGCNTAFDAGLYTFTFGDGSVTPARFTYTYSVIHGRWLITSHHSSGMPEK